MELKKHTPEEFEQMSDEEFENYEARLFEIAEEIFLKRQEARYVLGGEQPAGEQG